MECRFEGQARDICIKMWDMYIRQKAFIYRDLGEGVGLWDIFPLYTSLQHYYIVFQFLSKNKQKNIF